MVNSITNEISDKLNGKFDDGYVTWPDFKIFMEKAYTEMENLKTFLNTLKWQEKNSNIYVIFNKFV